MKKKMNFLPEENKKEIQREYLRRIIVLCGIFFFFTILISIVLLLLPFASLKMQKASFERQLSFSEQRLASNDVKDIIPIIEKLKEKISIIMSANKESKDASSIITMVLDKKTNNTKISGIFFGENKLTINGISNKREYFMSFLDAIKKEESFKNIESSPQTLLKEKDVDFAINIELR